MFGAGHQIERQHQQIEQQRDRGEAQRAPACSRTKPCPAAAAGPDSSAARPPRPPPRRRGPSAAAIVTGNSSQASTTAPAEPSDRQRRRRASQAGRVEHAEPRRDRHDQQREGRQRQQQAAQQHAPDRRVGELPEAEEQGVGARSRPRAVSREIWARRGRCQAASVANSWPDRRAANGRFARDIPPPILRLPTARSRCPMTAPRAAARLDVIGLGNAIVDVIAEADERLLERLDLAKGTMTLIDQERMAALYGGIGPAVEMSGGSCANTMAALASLGAKRRLRRQGAGRSAGRGVRATTSARPGSSSAPRRLDRGPPTARCLILVTPDAQRTMATYLGACVELGPDDVDEAAGRGRQDRLSRGLSLGSSGRQGGLPEGRRDRPSPRPPGRADPVRSVLRRPLARRVRRPDRAPTSTS